MILPPPFASAFLQAPLNSAGARSSSAACCGLWIRRASHSPSNMARGAGAGGWCQWPHIDRFCTNRNTHVIAVSEAIAGQLRQRGVEASRITVIRNFVEGERFRRPEARADAKRKLGLPQDAVAVLNVGRFVPRKARHDFLHVAAACAGDNRLWFLLVGQEPLEAALRTKARRLSLGDRLRLVPFHADLAPLYAASDALLHTAHWEPLANAILEATAAGLPVIASAVDGTREVIGLRVSGLLFTAGDAEAAAAYVRHLAGDPVKEDGEGQEPFSSVWSTAQFLTPIHSSNALDAHSSRQ